MTPRSLNDLVSAVGSLAAGDGDRDELLNQSCRCLRADELFLVTYRAREMSLGGPTSLWPQCEKDKKRA